MSRTEYRRKVAMCVDCGGEFVTVKGTICPQCYKLRKLEDDRRRREREAEEREWEKDTKSHAISIGQLVKSGYLVTWADGYSGYMSNIQVKETLEAGHFDPGMHIIRLGHEYEVIGDYHSRQSKKFIGKVAE